MSQELIELEFLNIENETEIAILFEFVEGSF